VNDVVGMVDVVAQISADNERERNPKISEEDLIAALRRRFQMGRAVRNR